MGKLNLSWLENAAKTVFSFGKKNTTSLMTGGGILIGWTAVYVFWKESRKAEEKIRAEEEKLNDETNFIEGEEAKTLSRKDKAIIYTSYCWPSLVMGLVSTGLNLGAHKLDMDEIAKAYVVSQFFQDKSERQGKAIEKMKAELPDKTVHELENDILEEEYPKEEMIDYLVRTQGGADGKTLFIDKVTHNRFRANIIDVTTGITDTNNILKRKRRKKLNKIPRDPYFAADGVFDISDDEEDDSGDQYDKFNDVFSSVGLDVFLDAIGETAEDGIDTRLDELLEFRYYGGGDPLKPKDILDFKQYADPETGIPAVCFIDYADYLSPTYELVERNPI